MKAWYLLAILFAASHPGFAQPVLNCSNTSPQAGESFILYTCGVSHVTQGGSGAAVTWNYSTLSAITTDTISYLSCPSASICDSFPGSVLASVQSGNIDFYAPDTNSFSITGTASSAGNIYYSIPEPNLVFPLGYGAAIKDTFAWHRPSLNWYSYGSDSLYGDGYGTLILPSGTWNNVIRVHKTSVSYDSNFISGIAVVDTYQYEIYYWYTPGFHSPLLSMYYDFGGSLSTPLLAQVIYYTRLTEAVENPNVATSAIQLYPNPATHLIKSAGYENVSLELYDVTGRPKAKFADKHMAAGMNNVSIPLPILPAGLYMLYIKTDEYSVVKPVEVKSDINH